MKQLPEIELRDYFAAQSISSLIKETTHDGPFNLGYINPERISNVAYRIADAMMKAREK